jgi:hypothetical protein
VPQPVDQLIARHPPIGVEHETCQQRDVARATHIDPTVVRPHLDRAEDFDTRHYSPSTGTPRYQPQLALPRGSAR